MHLHLCQCVDFILYSRSKSTHVKSLLWNISLCFTSPRETMPRRGDPTNICPMELGYFCVMINFLDLVLSHRLPTVRRIEKTYNESQTLVQKLQNNEEASRIGDKGYTYHTTLINLEECSRMFNFLQDPQILASFRGICNVHCGILFFFCTSNGYVLWWIW